MSEPMTVREYAAKKRVTLGTVYRWLWQGRLDARQLYGRWLITIEQSQAQPEPPTDVQKVNQHRSRNVGA
jgi:hypothetical protein